jgi:hypothetical protein
LAWFALTDIADLLSDARAREGCRSNRTLRRRSAKVVVL